jgi:hypothetical protein
MREAIKTVVLVGAGVAVVVSLVPWAIRELRR